MEVNTDTEFATREVRLFFANEKLVGVVDTHPTRSDVRRIHIPIEGLDPAKVSEHWQNVRPPGPGWGLIMYASSRDWAELTARFAARVAA